MFDLYQGAMDAGGEYVLGRKDLHTDACYLIYGILQPGETDRLMRPGEGYEEILCAVDGEVLMSTAGGESLLKAGHALHVKEDESFNISNPGDRPVVYVIAGGRTGRNDQGGDPRARS